MAVKWRLCEGNSIGQLTSSGQATAGVMIGKAPEPETEGGGGGLHLAFAVRNVAIILTGMLATLCQIKEEARL